MRCNSFSTRWPRISGDNSHATVFKQMHDHCNRFEIILACHSYGAEEIGENVSALSIFSHAPDIDVALHFKYDDCGPALFPGPLYNNICHRLPMGAVAAQWVGAMVQLMNISMSRRLTRRLME